MFNQLTAVLQALLDVHRQLLRLAERKREVIVAGKLPALQSLVKEETELVEQLKRLEQERTNLVQRMVPASSGERKVTLSQLLEQVDDEKRTRIQRLMKDLLDVIEQLQKENEQNQTLVKESLQYVQQTINVLTANPADDYLYRPKQSSDRTGQGTASMFDQKA